MQLLLPSARSGVLVGKKSSRFKHIEHTLIVFGILVVLLGGLDLLSKLPSLPGDHSLLTTAFAPAATLPF